MFKVIINEEEDLLMIEDTEENRFFRFDVETPGFSGDWSQEGNYLDVGSDSDLVDFADGEMDFKECEWVDDDKDLTLILDDAFYHIPLVQGEDSDTATGIVHVIEIDADGTEREVEVLELEA